MKKLMITTILIGSLYGANAQHTNYGTNSGAGDPNDLSTYVGPSAGQNSTGLENTFVGFDTGAQN
nr:hypothetical protein [Bacteroidota bacterium]